MGFSAGFTKIVTTITMSGTVPAPGSAPNNTLPDAKATAIATAQQELLYGTGEAKNDIFCAGEYIIAAGGTLTLNLFDGGTTTSDLVRIVTGGAAGMVLCKSLSFAVVSGGDESGVSVGGASSNEFSGFFGAAGDKVKIYPDGPALPLGSPNGSTVSATLKNVKLENLSSSEAVTVRVTASGSSVVPGMWMGFGLWTYA
jgi:hypothetical protein